MKKKTKSYPVLVRLLPDAILISISLVLSVYLRLSSAEFKDFQNFLAYHILFFVSIRLVCFWVFGIYKMLWRYTSSFDAIKLAQITGLSSLIVLGISFFFPDIQRLPRTVIPLEFLLTLFLLFSARIVRKKLYEHQNKMSRNGAKTLIYGAGFNGQTMAKRLLTDPNINANLVGFIDDDIGKKDRMILGRRVLGSIVELDRIITKHDIKNLIISIPNCGGQKLSEIVKTCKKHLINPKIVPHVSNITNNDRSIGVVRDIKLEDLISRDQKSSYNSDQLKKLFEHKVVLVTGAGGTIGSEIARQVFSYNPVKLILIDHSEYNLYVIDKELRQDNYDSRRVIPYLVDLKDKTFVENIVLEHRPHIVLHAAAYKHVHLVESNAEQAILNNVLSTKNLVDATKLVSEFEVFVLISSDKAVNPAGVMGATKRVCEQLTTAAAIETRKKYVSVRFGNVLGSSGSLIPLLEKQIKDGGPVTITHKDMTRYFMLIPEAVSLVLIASSITKAGDISVLKMGNPINIYELAKTMIALMCEKEVEIIFTGLRPGEKMFEELYIKGDELQTGHPDILVIPNGDNTIEQIKSGLKSTLDKIDTLIELAGRKDKKAIFILNEIVKSNYIPADNQNSFVLLKNKRDY